MFWNRGEKGISFTDKILEKALGDSSREPVKKIQVNKRRIEEELHEESAINHEALEEKLESANTDTQEETMHVPVVAEDAPVVVMETVLEEVEESHTAQSPDPILETAEEIEEEEAFNLLPPLKPKHIPVQVVDVPTVIPMATEDGVAHVSVPEEISFTNLHEEVNAVESETEETKYASVRDEEITPLSKEEESSGVEMSLPPAQEVELSPLERMPVHRDQYFRLESGETLKSIKDLIHSLETMNQLTWNHHVHDGRNDFANWVEHVFHDKTLAHAMRDYHNAHTLRVFLRNAF